MTGIASDNAGSQVTLPEQKRNCLNEGRCDTGRKPGSAEPDSLSLEHTGTLDRKMRRTFSNNWISTFQQHLIITLQRSFHRCLSFCWGCVGVSQVPCPWQKGVLLTYGGNHWKPVQTCSFEVLPRPLYISIDTSWWSQKNVWLASGRFAFYLTAVL